MAKKIDPSRAFNIAVVGLSGTEKEKGNFGVGKSCLCNRFVRPLADDYYIDHICVLSQTDFSGRVVNNDHFLFWGDVTKTWDEGIDFYFQVVEQTEFIDDASFQPFKSGKTDPYYKRCSATKLQSAEKLMYICKNQLGIEKEYDQKVLPEGKFCVDGFLCVFDVSYVQNRTIEKQIEYTALILNNLIKSKKPILVATTKCDEANEIYVREAEKLINRKEYKGNIPIVETSAHENVNIELAFIVLAQMIDRTRGRSKITPFYEAARSKKEILDVATEAYQNLIRTHVTDHRAVWNSVSKMFASHSDFMHYCELFGRDTAQRMFRRHVKKLKEEFVGQKMQMYVQILPEVLRELLPDAESINDSDWETVKLKLRQHPEFNQYFLDNPDEGLWQESNVVDNSDTRIPVNLLSSNEAEICFRNHINTLQAEQRRIERRKQFRQLLNDTGYVTPGKSLAEVRVLFMGRECFEELNDDDLLEVYELHQRDLTEKAKHNFQELLLEHADVFYHFASIGPGSVITQEDIREITEALQDDIRYKVLDKLDQDRTLMLLQHLGFVHGPIREHCPAYPDCMDSLIEKVIAQKAHRPSSWNRNSQWVLDGENNQLNLVLLGSGGLADDLANAIRAKCVDDTIEVDKTRYSLDYRIIDGDVNLPQNSFRTKDFLPHGCFCTYSSHRTLEYIRDSLEKTLLSNLEQEDRLPFHGLPIVIVFAADSTTNEKDLIELRDSGQHRAKSLQCPFIDVSCETAAGQQFQEDKVMEALNSLIESIQRRAGLLNIYHNLPDQAITPDIRIILCMLCGDPFSVEHVLAPLLSHQCCFITSAHSITLETYLGDSKRSVEVRVSSYHGANVYREELVHGFILVYSTKRKASLATLDAFSMNISNIPIQILAMTETGSANAFFSSDLSHQLITEGNSVADKLQAHFMTSTSTCQQKTAFYTPFFKEVWDKKPQIERAFNMEEEEEDEEDDEEEDEFSMDENSPHQPPPIPSRQESYHLTGTVSADEGSGDSEGVYEHLPQVGEEALSPEYIDDPPLSPSDDSEIYAHVYGERENGEHLIKPSQIKNRRSLHAGWVENRGFDNRLQDEDWLDNDLQRASKSKRAPPPTKPKPKPKPGKLNLKQYDHITDAVGKLKVSSRHAATISKSMLHAAPLATPEGVDVGTDYAQVKDAVPYYTNRKDGHHDYMSYATVHDSIYASKHGHHRVRSARTRESKDAFEKGSDSDSDWSSLDRGGSRVLPRDIYNRVNRKPTPHKKTRKRRSGAIPVSTPRLPASYLDSTSVSYSGKNQPVVVGGGGVSATIPEVHSLDPLNKARAVYSPSDESEASSDEYRSKTSHRPKVKQKKSFKLRRKKQVLKSGGGGQQSDQSKSIGVEPYPYVTSDTDMLSASSSSKLKLEQTFAQPTEEDAFEMPSPRDPNPAALRFGVMLKGKAEVEKNAKKKDKQKIREDEKLEKRRIKEEERQRRQTEKKEKKKKSVQGKSSTSTQSLEEFVQSDDNPVPLLLEKCMAFIEEEGLDSEGIYRVPGNRAHVELLFQKFEEDPGMNIRELDIAVNAVATALKDFFSKRLPPLLPTQTMEELQKVAGIQDKSCRLIALRDLLKKLPSLNFQVLKFVFQHFVKVCENCKLNSMDSKNLAICWWPTLLPFQFTDMGEFEQMRPNLEDIVQTMIDQFRFLFCGEEEVLMV